MNDTKEQDTLRADLQELCKKHGIRNASFCGTTVECWFRGLTCISPATPSEVFESVLNLGRLWQHSRTVIRNMMDEFEK